MVLPIITILAIGFIAGTAVDNQLDGEIGNTVVAPIEGAIKAGKDLLD